MARNCDGLLLEFLVFTQVFHYIRWQILLSPPDSDSTVCSRVFISSHQTPFLHTHSLFRLLSVLAALSKQTSSNGINHAGFESFRAALQRIQLFWNVCVCVIVWVCDCVSDCVCECVCVWLCECVCDCVYMCVSVCIYVCECEWVCVCVCVCVWVCVMFCMGRRFQKCRKTFLPFFFKDDLLQELFNLHKEITFWSAVISAESRVKQNPPVQFHRHDWYWSHAICRLIFIAIAN